VLSTVTTTFLDAYSAGVSSVSITHRIKEKWAAVAVTIAGTAAAMVYPMDNITDFLYLIGSAFAPMIAIQIADYFIIRQDHEAEEANLLNLLIWLAGFVIYRILMRVDTPVGSTLPDMAVTVVLCVVCRRVMAACCAVPGRENVTKV
jgi:purine-cytosine permease-like protein